MKNSNFIKTALSGAVFLAFSVSALAAAVTAAGTTIVTVTGALSTTQTFNFFVYKVVDTDGVTHERVNSLGTIPGGITSSVTFTLPYSVTSGVGTIFGIYAPGLVAVGMNPTSASAAFGQAFESIFPSSTEASLFATLSLGTNASASAGLLAFFDTNLSQFATFDGLQTPVSETNVHFSNGTAAGSFGISALAGPAPTSTPEPSSFLLAAPALLWLMKRKLARS